MRNKKRWSWTQKQKRRHTPGRYHHWSNVPRDFVRNFTEANRTKEKRDLKKVMSGWDLDFIDFTPKYPRRCAGWIYF